MFNTTRIRLLGDPVLKVRCHEVTSFDESLHKTADRLLDVLFKDSRGIGLAANQVGIMRHLFVYDSEHIGMEDGEGGGVLVNPAVVSEDGLVTYEEGCLSIPDFFYPLERPERVAVVGQSIDGQDVEHELSGLASRLFQHEIDHLNGLTMFDRMTGEERADATQRLWELEQGIKSPLRRRPRIEL
jgi:peptide deformylase